MPSFSSTRSLMRSILSLASMSSSISFPVRVFTLMSMLAASLAVACRFLAVLFVVVRQNCGG